MPLSAGYDTLLAHEGAADAELLRQCHAEGRQFLTQDTLIREHKAARDIAFILPPADLDQLAALVAERYQLDWLSHSFTRCLLDNTLLVSVDDAALMRVPKDVLESGQRLSQCPACSRIYWQGSHHKRMQSRLVTWQAGRKTG